MSNPAIGDVSFESITASPYIKPVRMRFTQDGVHRTWDMILVHNSVSILLFEVDTRRLVFVRQFRPSVYANGAPKCADLSVDALSRVDWQRMPHASTAVTLELCAGIVDKDTSLLHIAKEEIFEETGYDVSVERLEKITSFRSGVGITGAVQTYFYAEVHSSDRRGTGGGNAHEHECIDVQLTPCCSAAALALDERVAKPAGLLFALAWFYRHKAPPCCRVARTDAHCRSSLCQGFAIGAALGAAAAFLALRYCRL